MAGQVAEPITILSPAACFATTHWSMVLDAQAANGPEADAALEALCRTYYYPLYAFVRRQCHDPHRAQDLTQEFFHRFVARDYLASVAPEKGKFRSFLLASLKHFLGATRVYESAIKRGGRQTFVPLDAADVEERYLAEPGAALPPEAAFDRGWATTLMARALEELRAEYGAAGKADSFERLKPFLSREPVDGEYQTIAAEMNSTPGAVSVAVHRLRQRFGQRVRLEVANTVAQPSEIEEELRYLFAVLTAD